MNRLFDLDVKDTILYKDLLHRVKYIRNKELELNLERELRTAYEKYFGDQRYWSWNVSLTIAFNWEETPQGESFWGSICDMECPKEYRD